MNRFRQRSRQRGFTLIELMVVIFIIGLLVAILVPAVGSVRRIAKEAATKAVLNALGTGLESLKADGKIGGAYPPSSSDRSNRQVKSPYGGSDFQISGAGLLVWALSGADRLGPPGFKVFNPSAEYWSECTGTQQRNPLSSSDAYAKDNGEAIQPRQASYVDMDKVKMSETVSDGGVMRFVIPAETKARGQEKLRDYPMYLDSFGYPVLYYRADPAGKRLIDISPNQVGSNRGIYHALDGSGLVYQGFGTGGSEDDLLYLSDAGNDHHMAGTLPNSGTTDPANLPDGTFARYVADMDVKAALRPHNPDSYLLISPGYDGLYGTEDDIANFDHNGR